MASYRQSEEDNSSSANSVVKLHILESKLKSKPVISIYPADVAISLT